MNAMLMLKTVNFGPTGWQPTRLRAGVSRLLAFGTLVVATTPAAPAVGIDSSRRMRLE